MVIHLQLDNDDDDDDDKIWTWWDTWVDCSWKPEKEPKMNIAMVGAAMVTEEITALFLLASYRL